MRSTLGFFALLLLPLMPALSASTAKAAGPDAGRTGAPDTVAIHAMYLEGDFDRATSILETALREKRFSSHADSVFAFKHLGVMYAADNNSREKGKYYMLQLVTIEPTARIMDMYASDMIYMIFKNIQEEYEVTKGKLTRAERHLAGNTGATSAPAGQAPGASAPVAGSASAGPSRKTRNYLIAGGAVAALVGVGIATHYVLEDQPSPEKNSHEITR